MIKIFSMMAGAALMAGLLVALPGMSSKVEANPSVPGAKSDRIDFKLTGTACSQRGWPHFETNCLRNTTTASREAKVVRIVSTDRLR